MTGDEFKEWRKALGFSQDEAATRLGVSRATIGNYEAGRRREDDRPVEIPLAIILACDALRLNAAVARNYPLLLSDRIRGQVLDIAYHLSVPTSSKDPDGQYRQYATSHEALKAAGMIPRCEPSLLDRLSLTRPGGPWAKVT